MRRLLLLAPVVLALAGCGVVQSSEDEAADAARETATNAGQRLYGQRPRTAEAVGRSAAGFDGVEVLRVRGTSTHEGDGVELVVRTSGSAYNGWFDVEEVTVRRCFALRVSPEAEWGEEARDVDCPDARVGPPRLCTGAAPRGRVPSASVLERVLRLLLGLAGVALALRRPALRLHALVPGGAAHGLLGLALRLLGLRLGLLMRHSRNSLLVGFGHCVVAPRVPSLLLHKQGDGEVYDCGPRANGAAGGQQLWFPCCSFCFLP